MQNLQWKMFHNLQTSVYKFVERIKFNSMRIMLNFSAVVCAMSVLGVKLLTALFLVTNNSLMH